MGIYREQRVAYAGAFGQTDAIALQWGNAFPTWFQSPPPERTGFNGEYDYYGLQKRVEAVFRHHFSDTEIDQIVVSQRGRVVILQGVVRDRLVLNQLVDLARQVDGTYQVESTWVTCHADEPALLKV